MRVFSRFDRTAAAAVLALIAVIAATLILAGLGGAPYVVIPAPRVAYLYPADSSAPANIWMADPRQPALRQQITLSPSGITGFSLDPAGDRLAFAERNGALGQSDIKILDLDSGGIRQITDCRDSRCDHPVWSPDGRFIAYEVVNFNSDLAPTGVPVSPPRVWLIDTSADPMSAAPLFPDAQKLGYGAVFSADGRHIAVYDSALASVRAADLAAGTETLIPSHYGLSGWLSPDGARLVLPETGADLTTRLQMIDLSTRAATRLTPESDAADEEMAAWSPDGLMLAVSRREKGGACGAGREIYLVDAATLAAEPLVDAEAYSNDFFAWDSAGTRLIIQRTRRLPPDHCDGATPRPEIWLYDLASRALTPIAENAYAGRWGP